MKTLLLASVLFLSARLFADGDGTTPVWSTDYAAAIDAAAKTGRPILLNFTGSDWCVWCHRLRDEVFHTRVFTQYAGEALLLVELDFPRKKALPPELKKQNDSLAQTFDVEGYPTVLLLSPEGKVLGRLGYMQGGPKTFIREIKRLVTAGKKS
jgi:thioredoxin-related protein